jgi:hypothetical protein
MIFALCYLQGHEVIEKGAVDHQEDVYRLAPAVEDQAGCQEYDVPDIEETLGCDVICCQNDGQKIKYEDDAAK